MRSNTRALSRASSVTAASRLSSTPPGDKRVADRAVERRLGAEVVDMVQCQRGDRRRPQTATGQGSCPPERRPDPRSGRAVGGPRQASPRSTSRTVTRTPGSASSIAADSAPVHRQGPGRARRTGERDEQLQRPSRSCPRSRDEPADLDVVVFGVDIEVTLHRMRPAAGHRAEPTPETPDRPATPTAARSTVSQRFGDAGPASAEPNFASRRLRLRPKRASRCIGTYRAGYSPSGLRLPQHACSSPPSGPRASDRPALE